MLRNIFDCQYIPTLGFKPAEFRAVAELPNFDKDEIFPHFLLAPWVSSYTLEKGVEKILSTYPDRPFFLGVDRYYRPQDVEKPAQAQFLRILEDNDGRRNYFEFIAQFENAIPAIELCGVSAVSLQHQIERAILLGRGVLLTITDNTAGIDNGVWDALAESEFGDPAFLIDFGWFPDPLLQEAIYTQYTHEIFRIFDRAAVIISSASFPREFSNFEGVVSIPIGNRSLFNSVSARFNQEKIIYGDWGSTKPRAYQGGGKPIARIDYALRDRWVVSRNKDDEWGYEEAAENLVSSAEWDPAINVWGTNLIEQTALSMPFSISSSIAVVSARINIHLHRQARYQPPAIGMSTDEPWED
ncbi:MAG: hypothetical protein AAF903_10130 [Pseudomonadota bacterium]